MASEMTLMAQELYEAMTTKPSMKGQVLPPEVAQRTVERIFSAMSGYVNRVIQFETTVPMLRLRYEGEDFRDHFAAVDRHRHDAHDLAVTAVCQGNRYAQHYGVQSCLPDIGTEATPDVISNPNVRTLVADYCGRYATETFLNRDQPAPAKPKTLVANKSLTQEPHLDEAVARANRMPYNDPVPLKTERTPIDDSHIKFTNNGPEMGLQTP